MFRIRSVLLTFLLFAASLAYAQQYPNHPVRIIVGFAVGSGPDIQARAVAQQLSIEFGQSFYVENRVGANGTIAARAVTQSGPDGYTLLYSSSSISPGTPSVERCSLATSLKRPSTSTPRFGR